MTFKVSFRDLKLRLAVLRNIKERTEPSLKPPSRPKELSGYIDKKTDDFKRNEKSTISKTSINVCFSF